MDSVEFVHSYKHDQALRDSFNALATKTFGLNFEAYYQHGYWSERYNPYSLVNESGEIVANVSVNMLSLLIHNKETQAIQIGTVMTDERYRYKGYSTWLMKKVMEDFAHVDVMYLYANQSVLDFYPKFGFLPKQETLYTYPVVKREVESSAPKKLSGHSTADRYFIYQKAQNRSAISTCFSTVYAAELVMFYCLYVFPDHLYYVEKENAIVIAQHEGAVLHLFDVISEQKVDLETVIHSLVLENTTKVILHFTPSDDLACEKEVYEDSNVLFVRQEGELFPKEFKHPMTSQA
ncbi:GNAT family N-acetyltransferase [Priestia koreensis]|uniref:N-acetyltransferase domain-containing protein n=1 Tax=Priestia koreensis TaxID=284581 RepID=A0A0M0L678_9BACI|nr:GNAT family N-acetyltransferase [Priestia koreensis]KOO46178.1 hypothetical protein AMD01_09945 [Priestia koreensis]